MSLPESERFDCIARFAVETLNPDVCHLADMWVDDTCLQAVYQAADDPTICERLYLKGVRPTCRRYYQRPPVDFVTDSAFSVGSKMNRCVVEYRVAVMHWGNQAVEDLHAYLIFPEGTGIPAEVELEATMTDPVDLVEPNQGLIYEGEVTWETEQSEEEIRGTLDGAQIRLHWTFESERHDQLFPATTENGPDVFPAAES